MTLLTTPEGGKLYLVGTAHFSVESQNDVATVNKLYFTCTEYIRYILEYSRIIAIPFLQR